jgi:hypothetical protein
MQWSCLTTAACQHIAPPPLCAQLHFIAICSHVRVVPSWGVLMGCWDATFANASLLELPKPHAVELALVARH